jgi:hypothetical protein
MNSEPQANLRGHVGHSLQPFFDRGVRRTFLEKNLLHLTPIDFESGDLDRSESHSFIRGRQRTSAEGR